MAYHRTDTKPDLDSKVMAIEERLAQLEQSVGRLQNE
jgi:hypothetical protein